jgi:hypothetical protein
MTKDVTLASNPKEMPPTHNINFRGAVREQSPSPTRQPPIEPAKVVSGASGGGMRSAEGPARTFILPANVSAKQIQQDSFRYGGGRSAGKLSTKP